MGLWQQKEREESGQIGFTTLKQIETNHSFSVTLKIGSKPLDYAKPGVPGPRFQTDSVIFQHIWTIQQQVL